MTTARSKLVDVNVTRYYHCISRCVRGAFLCGKGFKHRKRWIEKQLEFLSGCFAVSVAGFCVMDNHLHVLVRLDPEHARRWSDEKVVRRWLTLHPPKGLDWNDEASVRHWLKVRGKNGKQVAEWRQRLGNLGWFMKSLKEPLSRMANREDGVKGAFWEGRYKSIAVLDDEALLATSIYIDLNPVAAGMAATPESSLFTSIRQRVNHLRQQGKLQTLQSARQGSVVASRTIGNAEQDHWLLPFEDRRPQTNARPSSDREGMLEKFTLGSYLQLLDYTGRLHRQGKARISDHVQQIFDRLDTNLAFWSDRVNQMLSAKELRGRCFAASDKGIPQSLRQGSFTRAINLAPQPAPPPDRN